MVMMMVMMKKNKKEKKPEITKSWPTFQQEHHKAYTCTFNFSSIIVCLLKDDANVAILCNSGGGGEGESHHAMGLAEWVKHRIWNPEVARSNPGSTSSNNIVVAKFCSNSVNIREQEVTYAG